MTNGTKPTLRRGAVAVAGAAILTIGGLAAPSGAYAASATTAPQPLATTVSTCTAWLLLGTCTTASIPSSGSHRIYYSIGTCGWGNIFDVTTGKRVGGSNLLGTGWISGLYGRYKLVVRNVTTSACIGTIGS